MLYLTTMRPAKQEPNPPEKRTDQDRVPAFANEDDIRRELFPDLESRPAPVYKPHVETITAGRIIKFLLALVTLVLTWYLFLGPGKATFEKFLNFLEDIMPPASNTPAPSPDMTNPSETAETALIETPAPATITPSPTAALPSQTPTPTETPAMTVTETATATMPAGPENCTPASQVTLADVGRVMCVTGNVLRTIDKPNGFIITLEDPKDAFYWISYERKWENLKKGTCVYATGEIKQLGVAPVMLIGYKIPLEYCP